MDQLEKLELNIARLRGSLRMIRAHLPPSDNLDLVELPIPRAVVALIKAEIAETLLRTGGD